jgi:hypothetical protein
LKCIISALNYIGIHYQYDEVNYKYTQNALKKVSNTLVSFKIHLFITKNTLLCFNIHTYTFQIHNSTFQKPYILLTYITIPLPYSNILLYTSIYIWNCLKTSLFRIFLSCYYTNFPKLLWCLIIPPRCRWHAMTFLLESKNQAYSTNPIHLIG